MNIAGTGRMRHLSESRTSVGAGRMGNLAEPRTSAGAGRMRYLAGQSAGGIGSRMARERMDGI